MGNEKIPEIVNRDEWDTMCPSKCGNNVSGIIINLGTRFGYCSHCDLWYDLETGEAYSNPLELEKKENKKDGDRERRK